MPTLAQVNSGQASIPNTGSGAGNLAIAIAQAIAIIQQMLERGELKKDRGLERELNQLKLDLLKATKDSEIKLTGQKLENAISENKELRQRIEFNEKTDATRVKTAELTTERTGLEVAGQGIANERGAIGRTVDQFQAEQQFAALEAEPANVAAALALEQLQRLKAAARQAALYMGPDGARRFHQALATQRLNPDLPPPVDPRFIDVVLSSQGQDNQKRDQAMNQAMAPIVREYNDLLAVYRRSIQDRDDALARAGRTPPDRETFEENQAFIADALTPAKVHPLFARAFRHVQQGEEAQAERQAIRGRAIESENELRARQAEQAIQSRADVESGRFITTPFFDPEGEATAPRTPVQDGEIVSRPGLLGQTAEPPPRDISTPAAQQLHLALMGPQEGQEQQLGQLQQQAAASRQLNQSSQGGAAQQSPSPEQEFKDELLKQLLMKVGLESILGGGGGGVLQEQGPTAGF